MFRMVLAAALAAVTMSTIIPGVAWSAEFNLRLASFATDASTWGRAQVELATQAKELSKGRIEVQIFNNSSLGSNREAMELAKLGSVDLVLSGASNSTRYAPQLNAVLLPFLWKDRATMFSVLDGPVGGKLNALLAPSNLRIVGWWDNGFRHVSNSKGPIQKPDDIKGLKLRTLPSSVHVAFFKRLGAIPTPMDWAEVMPALKQGVIDGQENPPAVVHSFRIFEAQKFYSLTGHVNEPVALAMSELSRRKLPAELQAALDQAVAKATAVQRQLNAEEEARQMADLRTRMQVNDVPAETTAAFRAAALEVYKEAYASMGEGAEALVGEIVALNR